GREALRRRLQRLQPGGPAPRISPARAAARVTHLERALELAERGRGTTHPNPVVGAVVVRDGEIVSEGWHERRGGPHAEVVALDAAGEQARGATLYVTMEPCAHHGSTPPCTEAVLRAGVAKVVAGSLAAGGGRAPTGRVLSARGLRRQADAVRRAARRRLRPAVRARARRARPAHPADVRAPRRRPAADGLRARAELKRPRRDAREL